MKKIIRVLSLVVAPLVCLCTFLAGCKSCGKKVEAAEMSGIMKDIDVAPTQQAAYEQYTKQALEEYKTVAEQHLVDGDIDYENEEVVAAACGAAAKLFAYACYNTRQLDKYVTFSQKESKTDLGSFAGAANVNIQEYFLRVNESENTCGYRYHYTIKKVINSSGTLKNLGLDKTFESARIRMTDKTNLLYRFEGSNIRFSDQKHEKLDWDILTCDWKTGEDWGKPDWNIVKGEFIEPADIEADIIAKAEDSNREIQGNINILADGMVKEANIFDDGTGGVIVRMVVDTETANQDDASLRMLRNSNDSENCTWTDQNGESGLSIVFRLWGNGLFRMHVITEYWSGKKLSFDGVADSTLTTYYSYSDSDCDMKSYLEMLEAAKALKEE